MMIVQCRPDEQHRFYQHIKDVLDFLLAFVLLILFLPLLLLIALIIRFDSLGLPIYCQQRVGRRGRLFTIYKFRTMQADAPCLSTEEMQRLGYDPSTRVGSFLRKSSLDELPQLLNILCGDMSCIGPRPALPTQDFVNTRRAELRADIVRPGITGLAQVMGRDALDDETKVQYDREYCQHLSFTQDIKVVFLTIMVVISARGVK